ncbi:hypothetical protein Xcab_02264 [Xenorhabdus cabanillasii JM26]|nr:hypothetical protein Xcab_02264 [Xenorhabdus cabanillasii JM26]
MNFEGLGLYKFIFFMFWWITIPTGLISSYAVFKCKNPIIKIICTIIALIFLFFVVTILFDHIKLIYL